MSPEEKILVDRGAGSVGGDLMLNRKVVGTYRLGSFVLTADGEAELTVEDVVFVEVVAPEVIPVAAKKPGKKVKAVEADVEPAVETEEAALADELDSLLAPVPDA